MSDWKHQDLAAEDSTAHIYDYLYNRIRFAKSMYSDFASEVDRIAKPDQHVLEIGCGTGTVTSLIRSSVAKYGFDISSNMLAVAKGKIKEAQFIQGDMDYLPYSDHVFDIIAAHSTLHHFPSLDMLLGEVRRILKPGGYLLIQEPNERDFRKAFFIRALAFGLRKIGLKRYPNVEHLEVKPSDHHAPLPIKKLTAALYAAGFRIEKEKLRYFSSSMLSGFDNALTHRLGRALDPYYIRKYNQGYMYLVIAK